MMNLKGVTKDTWARLIVIAFAFINQSLVIFGKEQLPFTNDEVYQIVSYGFTILASIWGYWKNNSFTLEAQASDQNMKELKAETKKVLDDKDEDELFEENEQIDVE